MSFYKLLQAPTFSNPYRVMRLSPITYCPTRRQSSATVSGAKTFDEIPQPPRYPLIGHLHLALLNDKLHHLYAELSKKHGDIFRLHFPGLGDTVILTNPEYCQQLLNNDGKLPIVPALEGLEKLRKDRLRHHFSETSGLISQGWEWYKFRQTVQQDMLRMSSALLYVDSLQDIAGDFIDRVAVETRLGGRPMDVIPHLHAYALDAMGSIFLGTKLGTLKGEPDGKFIIKVVNTLFMHSKMLVLLPYSVFRLTPGCRDVVYGYSKMLDMCREKIGACSGSMSDHADRDEPVLWKMIRKCGKESSIPVIMAADAMVAGIDTAGNTAGFLLYHLATHPDAQNKVYNEILEVVGTESSINSNNLGQMKYLRACIRESQRMLPVFLGSDRRTSVDMVIGGYEIPAGTNVMRIDHVMANSPENFDQPERFLPERWMRGCPERHTAHPYASLPFGHGRRACIGQRFAVVEIQVLTTALVRKFRLSYNGPKIDLVTGFLNKPSHPLKINFEERK